MKISSVKMRDFARSNGLKFVSTELKDGTVAQILAGKNQVSCFLTNNDSLIEARGVKGSPLSVVKEYEKIVSDLEPHMKEDSSVFDLLV